MRGRCSRLYAILITSEPFLAIAYVVAVAGHIVLVVIGLSLLVGYKHFGYGRMGLLAAGFLAPVLCGWFVVGVRVVRRVRAGSGFASHIRTLVVAPVLMALVAWFLYGVCRTFPHPLRRSWAEYAVGRAETSLDGVEMGLRWFYHKYGRLPKDLEELAKAYFGEAAVGVYRDPIVWDAGGSSTLIHYVQLDSTNILLYSVGPDLDDDRGEKEFTKDQLRYHKDSVEWRLVPFRNWLHKACGASAKLDGDITRRVTFPQRETEN